MNGRNNNYRQTSDSMHEQSQGKGIYLFVKNAFVHGEQVSIKSCNFKLN